jgi:hypothetical protein
MRCKVGALLFAVLLVATARAEVPRRIHFQRGRTSAEMTGRFTSKVTESLFVVHASKNQHMKVEIRPLTPNLITAGTVTAPSGKSDGAPGGVIFDSDLTETGDYRIRVFEREQNIPGRFAVRVDLKR